MKNRVIKDRTITFRLPEETYLQISHIAQRQWGSVSALIRDAIRRELNANEGRFD